MTTASTFSCHVCGDERPDHLIAVLSRVYRIADAGGATMSENIRYCVDRPSCVEDAPGTTFLPTKIAELSLADRIKQRWFGGK